MSDKIVYRDCINWSNNDHCAKTKCNYCTKNCGDYRRLSQKTEKNNTPPTSIGPCESDVFSSAGELRYFAESLIKSMREGHIRVACDPGYPFEPVRLLHIADRIERELGRRQMRQNGDVK